MTGKSCLYQSTGEAVSIYLYYSVIKKVLDNIVIGNYPTVVAEGGVGMKSGRQRHFH